MNDNKIYDFNEKYEKIIENLHLLFKDDINEKQSSRIIKTIKGLPFLTIFEAFNLIYREIQIIKSFSKYETHRIENMINFEDDKKDEYENEDFIKVIKTYKVKLEDNNIEDSWKPINEFDERRIIKINKDDNTYNYLPIKRDGINLDNNNKELFLKNDNEYLYHPLFFKTMMCHYCNKEKDTKKLLCPFSHDIQKDFRIIYDYKNEDICKYLNFLYNSELLSSKNYLNYIIIDPLKFDPNLFKLFKCPYGKKCEESELSCQFYHSSNEQRRPALLFRYDESKICNNKKNKDNEAEKCPLGIFCHKIHSENEYNYHPKIFRKKVECTNEKKNGHCIYIRTCYMIHPKEEYELYEKEDFNNEINNDEEIKELNEKIESINSIAECFNCRNCKKLPKDGKIKYLECKHFLCKACFGEIYNDNKECPFCDKKISKKKTKNLYFKHE